MPPVLVAETTSGVVPLGPALSIFDPVHVGIDEFGHPIRVPMIYRNMLIGGEPGAGKSALLNAIVAHAALALDCRLCLLDGKQVELGLWREVADVFVGPDIDHAITTLRRLQTVMDNRYTWLTRKQRRKVGPGDGMNAIVLAVDEIAYFSATIGDKADRDLFSALLRDIVARGRAVAVIVVGATQRPTADIIPTSLRDLFAYRMAFRCTTDTSSDVILGYGWAKQGYSANTVRPEQQGVGYLLAEGGIPRRVKCSYLSDSDIYQLADYATRIRRHRSFTAA